MYKTIEELVTRVDERNSDGTVSELIGVSIDKCFIKSVANTNGTDLSKYKIIRKNDFAVSLMQVSRDGKIPVARLEKYEEAIMSPAYPIFRVKDKNIILPEYLEMWFKRPEFDREAAFIAVGGVRGSMPWEEFAKMKLPVPPIEKQRKIVNAYKIVTDSIALKQKINVNNPKNKYFGYLTLANSRLQAHVRGSSQPFVSYDMLYEIKAVLPPSEVIEQFEKQVTPLFEQVSSNQREIKHLLELQTIQLARLAN